MRRRIALLSGLGLLTPALNAYSSATSADFVPCRKRAQLELEQCLIERPYSPEPRCWTASEQGYRQCAASVFARYAEPPPRKFEEMRRAQAAAEAARRAQERGAESHPEPMP